MTSDILLRHFTGISIEQLQKVSELFDQLETLTNLFYAVVTEDKGNYKFAYMSQSAETLTGHSLSKFTSDDGFSFFYSITPPKYRVLVLEQEAHFWKRARHPDFDASKPFILEMEAALEHINRTTMHIRLMGVILEFTEHKLPKLAVNSYLLIDMIPEEKLLMSKMETESILRGIQKVHREISSHSSEKVDIDYPIRLSYPHYHDVELTKQEYRVLKLLADGLSSKEISDKLFISIYTVETHRRHLLQKFKAANIAQMIKKATKLFWLE